MKTIRYFLAVVLLCALPPTFAQTLNAIDRGWYDELGEHFPIVLNYVAGDCRAPSPGCSAGLNDFRNFFVFDLSSLSGRITSAQLHLFNPARDGGFASPTGTETYQVNQVTTSIPSLIGGTAGLAGWADLGDGNVFGTYIATAADLGGFVDISLNAAGLAALNAAVGSQIAFGGSIVTLNDVADGETLFAFSNATDVTQLILTSVAAVPEPGTLVLFAVGLAGLVFTRRRKRAAQ